MEKEVNGVSKEACTDKPHCEKRFIKITSVDGMSRMWVYPPHITDLKRDDDGYEFKTIHGYGITASFSAVDKLSHHDCTQLALGPLSRSEIYPPSSNSLVVLDISTGIDNLSIRELEVNFIHEAPNRWVNKNLPTFSFRKESVSTVMIVTRQDLACSQVTISFKESIIVKFQVPGLDNDEKRIDAVFEYLAG